MKENQFFIEAPSKNKTWFLDTCVWTEIISSQKNIQQFSNLFKKNNYLAGLTIYTLFELSRATALVSKLDELFCTNSHFIWLAIPYDKLMQAEQNIYPNKPKMKWMPLSYVVDNDLVVNEFLTRLSNNPIFKKSLRDHLEFGDKKFMQLEGLKDNFPKSDDGKFTPEQAHDFALISGIQYFLRNDPSFIKKSALEISHRNIYLLNLPEHCFFFINIIFKDIHFNKVIF